jgi:ABC-2 type transport system permease protein
VIRALFTASWRHLCRDRAALLLSFVFPVAFFSVSALAFERLQRSPNEPIRIHAADLERSPASRRLLAALAADPTVDVREALPDACSERSCAFAAAARSIASGRAASGLVIADGAEGERATDLAARLTLLAPDTDPVGELLLRRALADALDGASAPRVELAFASVAVAGDSALRVRGALSGLLVVFLLFTAAGASGWLVEEEQQATLTLLLTTRAGLGRILGSQWLFLASLGAVQAGAMLVWATVAFGLPWTGAPQVLRVSLTAAATAAVTAAFGIFLAALVRTRAQLGATSTIAILLLSAIGGSFAPRAALPEPLQAAGVAIPTTWAVAGLWQALDPDAGAAALWTPLTALAGFAALLLAVASLLARRRVVL